MFDAYLAQQQGDPRRRRILLATLSGAIAATIGTVALLWLSGKMLIIKMDAPTIEFALVQFSPFEAPPPPPPPPPPSGSDDSTDLKDPVPEDPEILLVPVEVPPRIPKIAKRRGTPRVPGVEGGVIGGVPNGLIGSLSIGSPVPVRVARPARPKAPVTRKPVASVMAQARYAPDPDPKALAQTKSGRFSKNHGTNVTSFCVDVRGQTTEVRTKRAFPGDPQVDAICRDTVKSWRFEPFKVAGRPVKTCSEVRFNLSFR